MPNQDNIYTLATTNCRLPHYALCYKDTPLITDSENSTEAQIPDNGNNSTTEDRKSLVLNTILNIKAQLIVNLCH